MPPGYEVPRPAPLRRVRPPCTPRIGLRVRRHGQPCRRAVGALPGAPQHSLEPGGRDADAHLRGRRDGSIAVAVARAGRRDRRTRARRSTRFAGETIEQIAVDCEQDVDVTFVHVTRDLATFSPDELALQAAHLRSSASATRCSPTRKRKRSRRRRRRRPTKSRSNSALDALRDPAQRQRLVGVREEKRVIVYFVHPGKRTKARARS